jgi:hypothetical protein
LGRQNKEFDFNPDEEIDTEKQEGLIEAKGILAGLDDEIDKMIDFIYKTRKNEKTREVNVEVHQPPE